ncbi:MAG: hypothetical protein ACXW1Y_00870 [Acidimicrobiia bacterium]
MGGSQYLTDRVGYRPAGRRLDIGRGDVIWVVMADPEGNELCVLRSYTG